MIGGAGGAVAGTAVMPVAGTVGGGVTGVMVGAGEGAIVGVAVANVAEVAAEGVVVLGEGRVDATKRAVAKTRIIVGLLGQLVGMGDPLPNPRGPDGERTRVERPQNGQLSSQVPQFQGMGVVNRSPGGHVRRSVDAPNRRKKNK